MKIKDNALEVFETSIQRTERMARLYHGLVDTRVRAVRTDWADSFEKFMHWKKGEVIGRVDGHEALVVIKSGSELSQADFESEQLKDLLRASLVLAVSSMDAYFHRKIRCYIVQLAKLGDDAPKALKKQDLTVLDFVKAMGRERKWGELGRVMGRKLGYMSLQSPSGIESGLNLIGVSSFWSSVAKKTNYDQDLLKKHLAWVVARRNKIAHEGDISLENKNFGQVRDLAPGHTLWSIELISKIVRNGDAVINDALEKM